MKDLFDSGFAPHWVEEEEGSSTRSRERAALLWSSEQPGAGRCSDVLLLKTGDSQRLKARESALAAPKRADKLVGVIAYSEWCRILDLRRRFSFGTGTRLDQSKAFV